ncbi:Uncharacterised protein [Vibrio cholerae]|nr:Uncharacterised protein [Vibrio cholerae]CSB21311.1 Uncharacterised protein [Vibrio cholerae]CSC19378.1 Uncharacterised protein [Vibrio cholerae]CSC38537.1 Uncharacterised protein [Vibrio cholerae]CSI40306.1 Uncharacterised protein [Vibrio cholerae]
MHAVATNTVLFVQVVWQSVQVRFFWHCLVERSVEYRNIFQLWERFLRRFDTDDVCWVVQWSECCTIFDAFQYSVVNQCRLSELLTTVYHAVTDRFQLSCQFWFRSKNSFNDERQSFIVCSAFAQLSFVLAVQFPLDTSFRKV